MDDIVSPVSANHETTINDSIGRLQHRSSPGERRVEICSEDQAPMPPQYLEEEFAESNSEVKQRRSAKIEICSGDEDEPPRPPQYLEEEFAESNSEVKQTRSAKIETCSGDEDEPPRPPQYLEELVVDSSDTIVNKKKPAKVSNRNIRADPSPTNTNRTTNEDWNVQQLRVVPPGPDIDVEIPQDSGDQAPARPPSALNEGVLNQPPDVPFYECEARAVDDSESNSSDTDRDGARQPVYVDAVLMPPASWWQRHQRGVFISSGIIVVLIVGAATAIGIIIGRTAKNNAKSPIVLSSSQPNPVSTSLPTLPPTTPPTTIPNIPTMSLTPAIRGITNITHQGDFFEADCEEDCGPYLAIQGDTAVVAPAGLKYFEILNRSTDGSFKAIQKIEKDKQPLAIAIFNDVMAVGLPTEAGETGAIYMYERNATGFWTETQRIVPDDSREDADFGSNVNIDNDVMVVGAFQDREGKIGSIYIYSRHETGWAFEQKIAPVDDKIKNFGNAVAIKANRIAVGDRTYDEKKGAVWIYEYSTSTNNWTQLHDKELNGVMTNDECDKWYGASLAFTYDHGLLVGCPKEDNRAGAVYFYEPSDAGYVFRQKIVTSDGSKNHEIGGKNQIAVHGNTMVAGISQSAGGVYIFLHVNEVWVEATKIESPYEDGKFGNKVALSGNNLLVASKYNAHFYELVDGPPTSVCMSSHAGNDMFDIDCQRCNPHASMDGDSVVISKDKESLQILSSYGKNLGDVTLFGGLDYHKFGGVAISGDLVIAGAPNVNGKNGSVTVFEMDSGAWLESEHLSPDVIGVRENFGGAVDIDGNSIVAGAYDYIDKNGSIYVFRRNESSPWSNFTQEAKLLPDDPNLKGFGKSVSIDNNTVAAGDQFYEGSTGAVFVYSYEPLSKSWTQLNQTITNIDCDGEFGSSIALTSDNGLLIGCPGEQSGTGAVYYYTRASGVDQYILKQKITHLNGRNNDKFGGTDRIAVDGIFMVVGTEKETNGTAHVFANMDNAWIDVDTIESPTGGRDLFGYSVAISGRKILVSSINNVYSYTLLDIC